MSDGIHDMVKRETLRETDDPAVGGVKFDNGKLRHDLVPVEGINAVADILTGGAAKYGDRNWEKGMAFSRPFSACLRHLYAWWGGEESDRDSGRNHLWHAACNLFFLIAYSARGTGTDDRPNKS